jgi:tripartite-type tricarboxylate transporter receptor subunit TctC
MTLVRICLEHFPEKACPSRKRGWSPVFRQKMRPLKSSLVLRACALAGMLIASVAGQSRADPVADFYRGRTIELDVGTGVGGGYDANARLVARHLGRFLPGNPTILVNNMPGGGGIRAANALYNKAARDGAVIGTFSNAMITEPLLGGSGALFAPASFTWIGSASRENGLCVAARDSRVASWSDLLDRELIVGTAAPGTTTYMYPVMLRNLFGARFKPVTGYPDGGQIALALERGEVQSICQTYSSIKIGHPDWLRDRRVRPLIALGLTRIGELPELATAFELAKDAEQSQILKVILAPTLAGRPFVAPPGIPQERAQALRQAFAAMTRDPVFLEDARALRMDIEPAQSSEIEALVQEIYALPESLIAKTRRAVTENASGK